MVMMQFQCPIIGCEWSYVTAPPEVKYGDLARAVGHGVMAMIAQSDHARRVERTLHDHLQTHWIVDYVRTISEEREKVLAWVLDTLHAMDNGDVEGALTNQHEALAWLRGLMHGPEAAELGETTDAD